MDLLGSILGSMAKPPQASEEERQKKKKEFELVKKMAEKEKQLKLRFREKAEEKINSFLRDGDLKTYKFPPMDKFQRSIIHDVAEVAGLVTFSFGEEDVDRYIQVWKKEFSPCEGEVAALRRGEEWDPVKFKQKLEEEAWQEKLEAERARTVNKIIPKTDYKNKYEHLIGKDSALDAARKTETNKSYGMVSAESKKDKRTVEQVQAEIRAKKRLKQEACLDSSQPACPPKL
ncbi:sperm-associated antigen 7 [Eurytemora carolleeae]|uniref:sperm-associated antigen 7 n=1 Tax=Eurytemora carolleeae TaxID=1294199 RepID=UPI000C775B3F|nr:sperm-associated antigen 7 [Eurytemora carolleeae]|eukprot:XP_023323364.1 sperm-associated antigen 7-like [Eurytemora affinis]